MKKTGCCPTNGHRIHGISSESFLDAKEILKDNSKPRVSYSATIDILNNNIINDFRKTNTDTVEEIDYSNDNNIVEPIADLIFKVIVSIFPKFKKGN